MLFLVCFLVLHPVSGALELSKAVELASQRNIPLKIAQENGGT